MTMQSKKKIFLVAEISSNHNGSFYNAKKLIKAAKDGGANAVKLQTYTPNSMTINSNKKYFIIKEGLWKGYKLWDLYNKAKTPYSWHKHLFEYGRKIGIKVFSTPFDEKAVDFLEKLNCPFYKVASFEMNDLPLIKKIISTKKPIIISTGMASLKEISYVYNKAKEYGAKKITLLYCVSNYPANLSDFNFNNIKIMKKKFKCEIGFSDHSTDYSVAAAAYKAGATIFEKHICLKGVKSLDYEFSINQDQISEYKKRIIDPKFFNNQPISLKKLLGSKKFKRKKSEDKSKQFRRSLFVVKDIKKGEIFTTKNLKKIRPGLGVHPSLFEKIISLKSPINLKSGEPLSLKILKKINFINEKS